MSRLSFLCSCVLFLCLPSATLWGQEFRMDTDVFVGKEKEPIAQTLTIFTGSRVYDFMLTQPREIVVWDSQRGTFTLLDEEQKRKAVVTSHEVIDYAFAVKTQANEQPESLFAFASNPKFTESAEEIQDNSLTLTRVVLDSPQLRYEAKGQQPKFPQAVKEYNLFATWYARLNATRPGNLPPEARIALNRALADRGLIPIEVLRTITASGRIGNKKLELRSHHLVNWTLSGEDQKKMERADDAMAKFSLVSFDEYTKPAAKTVKK